MVTSSNLLRVVVVAFTCALTGVMAQVRFSLGPVPYTMQNVGVVLSGLLLPPKYAAGSMILYLLLIALGLPLAAGFMGGPSVILGYCGGYLAGFVFSAPLMSLLGRSYLRRRGIELSDIARKDFLVLLSLSFLAILPTYALGFTVFTYYAVPGSALYQWSLWVSSWLGLHVSGFTALFIASILIFIPQDLFMDHVIAIATARSIARLLRFKGARLE